MEKIGKEKVWQAVGCLICIVVLSARLDTVGASEFSGGRLTGPLFTMAHIGTLLFPLALALTFFLGRLAAAIALLAAVLCSPLYLYFLLPGPYRWIFKGEYSVPIQRPFSWDNWAIAGILSLLFAAILSFAVFRNVPQRTHNSDRSR
jgi:hypothetical protein